MVCPQKRLNVADTIMITNTTEAGGQKTKRGINVD